MNTNSNKSYEMPENFLFMTVLLGTVLMKCIQELNFVQYSIYNTIYFIMKCYSWLQNVNPVIEGMKQLL